MQRKISLTLTEESVDVDAECIHPEQEYLCHPNAWRQNLGPLAWLISQRWVGHPEKRIFSLWSHVNFF